MIKQWLVSVTAAAMLLALAEHMTPQGTVRRISRLTQGLVLFVVVLQPVKRLEDGSLSAALSEWRMSLSGYEVSVETGSFCLMKELIEAQTAAYIQDKAAQLGIQCDVQVVCSSEEEGQTYPCPERVTIRGALSAAEREQVSRLIESELALSPQAYYFEEEGAERS